MDRREELTKEVRYARGYLIVVGGLMFALDLLYLFGFFGELAVSESTKLKYAAVSAGVLVVFLALAYFTAKRPVLCLALGLAVFWGIQLIAIIREPANLTEGLIIKAFFTYALIRGLRNASRAKSLLRELEEVFE